MRFEKARLRARVRRARAPSSGRRSGVAGHEERAERERRSLGDRCRGRGPGHGAAGGVWRSGRVQCDAPGRRVRVMRRAGDCPNRPYAMPFCLFLTAGEDTASGGQTWARMLASGDGETEVPTSRPQGWAQRENRLARRRDLVRGCGHGCRGTDQGWTDRARDREAGACAGDGACGFDGAVKPVSGARSGWIDRSPRRCVTQTV